MTTTEDGYNMKAIEPDCINISVLLQNNNFSLNHDLFIAMH